MAFTKPLPAWKVCNLCGVSPRIGVVLPCSHTYCELCFEDFADGGCCLIDNEHFKPDQVWRVVFQLTTRVVSCWNAQNGCNFVGSLKDLRNHYQTDCEFHAASCPRCKASVLRRDLVAHFKAGCGVAPSTNDDPSSPASDSLRISDVQRAYFNAREALGKVADDRTCLQRAVDNLSGNLKALTLRLAEESDVEANAADSRRVQELLREILTVLVVRVASGNSTCRIHLGEEVEQLNLDLPAVIQGVSRELYRLFTARAFEWDLRWPDAATFEHSSWGSVCIDSGKRYAHGYCVSQGVVILSRGDRFNVLLGLTLHKGLHDDEVEWPFGKVCVLRIVHPDDAERTISVEIDTGDCPTHRAFQRPVREKNASFGTGVVATKAQLEEEGFFVDGSVLRLRMEVMP
ncbi:uncharacterized protein LOC8026440 [Ixodes scapularis]|uniref:uncharacterized protein LOC8026440 n=1 Tax=Ixodes scapularis TaxID=6945 RepID=UPI001A9ED98A|nr:uncharacterized protein LOC8026440 [Ixodes scapularis]